MQIIDIYSKNFKPHSRFNSTIYLLTGKCALSSSRSHSTAHHPANFLTFRLLRSWHNRVQSNFLLFHLFLNLFFRLETQYCLTVLIFLLKNFATFFCDSRKDEFFWYFILLRENLVRIFSPRTKNDPHDHF